ncbi:hypothetical protein HG531_013191 [Fusarium graminearum]|nr:hypothetical protein HG531_013191 [Fusarium graminearum]
MQGLVAPVRAEVDAAHRSGHWLEIGVPSLRNFRFLSRRKIIYWSLFCLSSVPLQLTFNGAVLEARSTNAAMVILGAEELVKGGCSNKGWKPGDILKNKTNVPNLNDTNPFWGWDFISLTNHPGTTIHRTDIQPFSLTSKGWELDTEVSGKWISGTWDFEDTQNVFDSVSGLFVTDPRHFTEKHRVLQVDHCLSERFIAPCQVNVSNSLLLIACVMCTLKSMLCILVLRLGGNESPLMTPGDAIASFIAIPDEETKGMCTSRMKDLATILVKEPHSTGGITENGKWLQGPRQWEADTSTRRFGDAVPKTIWRMSYLLMGSSLVVATAMLILALLLQPLSLVLSVCYFTYNGLFTRMLSEFAWSKYSTEFRALRVTEPQGEQKSTYSLQLPYRFSVPIILVSTLLHWIYSNCIYVSHSHKYEANWPYDVIFILGVQFSTKAILIGFYLSLGVTISPALLAYLKLPGTMVIAGGNSTVISAAYHYPLTKLQPIIVSRSGRQNDEISDRLMANEEHREFEEVARQKVKRGVLFPGNGDESLVGHLGFGTKDSDISELVEGEYYSGL